MLPSMRGCSRRRITRSRSLIRTPRSSRQGCRPPVHCRPKRCPTTCTLTRCTRRLPTDRATATSTCLGAHGAGYKAPPEIDPAQAARPTRRYGGHRSFCFRRVEDLRAIMEKYGERQEASGAPGVRLGDLTAAPSLTHPTAGTQSDADRSRPTTSCGAYKWAKEQWSPWIGVMTVIYISAPDFKRHRRILLVGHHQSRRHADGRRTTAVQSLAGGRRTRLRSDEVGR